jgi:hypothetical protein
MFTYQKFDRRAPEVRLILHYKEELFEQPDAISANEINHEKRNFKSETIDREQSKIIQQDVIVIITAIHTGKQYKINTEEKKFAVKEEDPVILRYFKMRANDIKTVFDYVALYLIKNQLMIEYNLLSPRVCEDGEERSYIMVSDHDVGSNATQAEDKLWRYLRMLKDLSVQKYRTELL